MSVIDASLAVTALADITSRGTAALVRLRSTANSHAPELMDPEVISALRGRVLGGRLTAGAGETAVRDLAALRCHIEVLA